ncbi:Sulfotransferase domain [Dillenia turbinata]|uniref:Sulfotransferase n=1 Tax=Dillenia turbinata TaxID=194707 RepID=A0AAN8ZF04_9MAGN
MPETQPSRPSPCSIQEEKEPENELPQDLGEFLSSLPKDKDWVLPHLYQYQGFWHSPKYFRGLLACQQHFQPLDTDIILITNPKSGTTWLKALVYACVNRVIYPPNSENHPLLTNVPHDLVPFLELELYNELNHLPDLSSIASPRIFSTHLPYVSLPNSVKDSQCKVVYLCRNPKDTFVSLWHFCNKLRNENQGTLLLEEAFDLFCRGVCINGPYWDHVLSYWKASLELPRKVCFVKYEELQENPFVHVKRLADFLGYSFTLEEEKIGVVDEILKLCSFENLSNLEVNRTGILSHRGGGENQAFFRQGKVGDWVKYLTPEMSDRFDQITRQKFEGSGLDS